MTLNASDPSVLAVIIGLVVAVGYLVSLSRQLFSHDAREPPLAPQAVPLIGHIIGLSRRSFNYSLDLSKQVKAPIFTMPLPGQKMYIVAAPDLVRKIQKQHRILAFPPIQSKFACRICCTSKETRDIMAHNINGDDGDFGLSIQGHYAFQNALRPGQGLDDMNRSMLRHVGNSLDQLQPGRGSHRNIGLSSWLREALTLATTNSVYGPLSPFNDSAIRDAFWEFESGLMSILIGFLPSITARKPIAALVKVADAFEKYYQAGGINSSSILTQTRFKVATDHKVPINDIARFELGGSIAILVNTVPAAFWTLFLIHSHPGLLKELRREVDACIESATTDGHTVKRLSITTLKKNCPLLLSSYQETLRYGAMGTSVREVMEDTFLDQYLLKKGAMIQMPSRVIHHDTTLWGPSASEFNPTRFLPEEKKNRPSDVCFRAFGGGKTLCPGRHFATNEVLAVVAAMIARFDIEPVGGEWKAPTTAKTNPAAVIMEPDEDIEVVVKAREDGHGAEWIIDLDKSGEVFAMVTEDSGQ